MGEVFDGKRAFEHIEKLSAIKRLPGTPGETQAQEYIKGVGDDIGVPMRWEEFTYSSAPLTVVLPLVSLLLGIACIMGSLTYLWETSLSIIPGVVLLVMIYLGFKWSAAFEHFGATGGSKKSLNLIGEIKGEDPRGTIILSAHYDSKSQLMPVVVKAGLSIVGFFTAILLGLALVVVGILSLAGADAFGSRAGFFISLFPAVCLVLLVFNFTGNRSTGALDNASGEAVILEAARVLAREPLKNHDMLIASFGCEEVGLCGAINYLLAHEEELKARPTYMLNFDMPFSTGGNIFVNTAFELPPRYTSKYINELARKAAADKGLEIKGLYMPVGAAADHMPWNKHGIEATGFVSAAGFIHSSRDSVDKINREGLQRTGEVTLAVVRSIDQEVPPAPGSAACGVEDR
ncbi:MAG: M28 family metallopeptidase [Actinobacteria bacterium]|nr:M28 family metallopeptidase [Actinomycetota bacterium]